MKKCKSTIVTLFLIVFVEYSSIVLSFSIEYPEGILNWKGIGPLAYSRDDITPDTADITEVYAYHDKKCYI